MEKKFLLSVFVFAIGTLISQNGFSQKGYVERINQYNEAGEKDGYWVEKVGTRTTEGYYRNGVKDGVSKYFSPNRNLSYFTTFKDGEEIGPLYRFGDKGHLMYIITDFAKSSYVLDNKEVTPPI